MARYHFRFLSMRRGRLHPASPNPSQQRINPFESHWFEYLQTPVRMLDRCLRRLLGIFEFCADDECILRIAKRGSPIDVFLPDGTEVRQGDGVVELHFWNENLATLNCRKSTFGWGVRFRSGMRISLQLLANYANQELSADTAKAFYARLVFPVGGRFHACARVAADYGFTLLQPTRTLPRKVHDFFENILIHALCWTFNPGRRRHRSGLARVHCWISRKDLITRYRRDSELNNGELGIAKVMSGNNVRKQHCAEVTGD